MAQGFRLALTSLSAVRHCQTGGLVRGCTGVLHRAPAIQRRQYSSDDAPPYEEFNVQNNEDFNQRVLNSKIPTLVDFHASWCKPCHTLAPRLHEVLSERPGRVQLAKVDVDQNTDLAMEYDVSSIPKVLMVKEGKVAGQFVGLMEKDKLESFVDRLTL